MSWINDAEKQAKEMGFKSALGDLKYWIWVVEKNFPPPWDRAEKIDKDQVMETVNDFWRKENNFFNDKLEHCGVPSVYRKSKGIASDAILKIPICGQNNFFFIADSMKFAGEEHGEDPKDTGKTTELCSFIIRSVHRGQFSFYRTSDDLQNAIDNDEYFFDKKAFDWAREVDVLVLDDVGRERPKFKTNHIERILNYRLDYGKKTVFSIACDSEKFAKDYERIWKRISSFTGILFRSRS